MSTWRNVGITYLKYADICATHVRNSLKEPAKTKAKSSSNMHARITQWEAGKRGEPREPRRPTPPCRPPLSILVQGLPKHEPSCKSRRSEEGAIETAGGCLSPPTSFSFTPPPTPHPPRPDYLSLSTCLHVHVRRHGSALARPALPCPCTAGAAAYAARVPRSQKSWRRWPRRRVVSVLQTKFYLRARASCAPCPAACVVGWSQPCCGSFGAPVELR